jgi:hypothetical protein
MITATAITTSGPNIAVSYQWESSTDGVNFSAISGATAQNYAPGQLTTTTYFRRRASANNGCSDGLTNPIEITINPLPIVAVNSNECSPQSLFSTYTVILTVTHAQNLATTAGVVTNNGGGMFTVMDINVNTNVVFTATNTVTGCQTSIQVNSPSCFCPTIQTPVLQGTNPAVICQDDPFPTFTVTIDPHLVNGPNTVDWYDAATAGNLLLAGSLTYTPMAAGVYYAEGRNISSSCTSDSRIEVVLQINPLPTPTIAGNLVICQGQSTTLTATGGTSYLWSNGAATRSITVNPASTTSYTVTATNANNCSASTSAIVVVNPNPTATLLGNPLVCNGQSTTLTASGAGTGGAYLWNTGATTASLTVSPTGLETYTVTVTNANGCTDATSITVNESPAPTVISASAELCAGHSTTLTASGGVSYQWAANGNNATTAAITVTPATTTTYTVTATNAAGCANAASVTIAVLELPEITNVAVVQPTSCNGTNNGSLTVTATGPSASLQYRINGGSWQVSNVFNNLGAGTYNVEASYTGARCTTTPTTVVLNPVTPPSVVASPDAAICRGSSTNLTASGSGGTGLLTYTWTPGNQTGASVSVNPTVTITYTVTVEDQLGCTNTDEVTITVNDNPTVAFTKTDATCGQSNGTIALSVSGGQPAYTYAWTPNVSTSATATGLIAGTYNVTVTDVNGCTGTNLINIQNLSAPTVTAAADQTICAGSPATLSASTNGGTGNVSLSWSPGNLSGNNLVVNPTTTTTYTVTATDASGCSATDQLTVNVDPAVVSGIAAPTSICALEGVLYIANPAIAGATYNWTFDGPATPASSAAASATVMYDDLPGVYNATLTITRGTCTETYNHAINITQAVFAAAGTDPWITRRSGWPAGCHLHVDAQFVPEFQQYPANDCQSAF